MEDGEDVRANLERIKKGEAEAWLRESEETYKCPKCRKPLPVGRMKRKCYHCGADLSKSV
jgi:ribosomal protein L37AE/L43A